MRASSWTPFGCQWHVQARTYRHQLRDFVSHLFACACWLAWPHDSSVTGVPAPQQRAHRRGNIVRRKLIRLRFWQPCRRRRLAVVVAANSAWALPAHRSQRCLTADVCASAPCGELAFPLPFLYAPPSAHRPASQPGSGIPQSGGSGHGAGGHRARAAVTVFLHTYMVVSSSRDSRPHRAEGKRRVEVSLEGLRSARGTPTTAGVPQLGGVPRAGSFRVGMSEKGACK